jgi:hypothetical protein
MDLSRDVPGYSISPHTDTRHKLVTTLFYLCNTTAWPEAGTQFLVSSEGKESAHGSGRVKWDDTMKVAKQVRIPNPSHLTPVPLRFPPLAACTRECLHCSSPEPPCVPWTATAVRDILLVSRVACGGRDETKREVSEIHETVWMQKAGC